MPESGDEFFLKDFVIINTLTFFLFITQVASFWKCMNTAHEEDDDSDTLAVGCLSAISNVLESVSTFPHLFAHIEPILLPIMRQTMLPTNGQGN